MATFKQLRFTAPLAAAISLSACAALNDSQTKVLPITEIYSAATCNIVTQGITKIKDEADLQRTFSKLNSHHLSPPSYTPSAIDFNTSMTLLISLGTKPNSGYSLNATSNTANLSSGVLDLPIDVHTPDKGQMYAQMMTSPCMIITLPSEPYETINIESMSY